MAQPLPYAAVRQRSLALAEPLSAEDCTAQSMPDTSPVKWHLAHTSWFFETFVLAWLAPEYAPFDPAFRMLFNSYYQAVGAAYPRAQRGLLTRPALARVLAYRKHVDAAMQPLLAAAPEHAALAGRIALGLAHEQQHQELILTDIKHLLAQQPQSPPYLVCPLAPSAMPDAMAWLAHPGGRHDIGHAGLGFAFDHEGPRHTVWLAPFQLASRLVSNGEYLRFIEAGGYQQAGHWLAEGWDLAQSQAWQHPLYWRRGADGQWQEFTLHGLLPLDPARPVCHLSLFEADAYASWAGARLPTEAEWECMVAGLACEQGDLHPAAAAAGQHLQQMYGHAWQWTSSSYAPYPGFASAAEALGEYNGKFMVNQYVLRGSSCLTAPGHARASYRNFFPASARWQCSALRLAR